jgi:hypothetical protein
VHSQLYMYINLAQALKGAILDALRGQENYRGVTARAVLTWALLLQSFCYTKGVSLLCNYVASIIIVCILTNKYTTY